MFRMPRARSSRRRPKLADAADMDFEFVAIRLTALQAEPQSGSTLWKRRRAGVTCGILLSFRSATRCLIICFIGTGRGARPVSNNGVKGGVKPDHKGGVKVDQYSMCRRPGIV